MSVLRRSSFLHKSLYATLVELRASSQLLSSCTRRFLRAAIPIWLRLWNVWKSTERIMRSFVNVCMISCRSRSRLGYAFAVVSVHIYICDWCLSVCVVEHAIGRQWRCTTIGQQRSAGACQPPGRPDLSEPVFWTDALPEGDGRVCVWEDMCGLLPLFSSYELVWDLSYFCLFSLFRRISPRLVISMRSKSGRCWLSLRRW
jgi:hypothetical protein